MSCRNKFGLERAVGTLPRKFVGDSRWWIEKDISNLPTFRSLLDFLRQLSVVGRGIM